jgi:hypothetical protein
MSDEAQRMYVRILLWAIFIVVVSALIGVVYYYVAIKPGMHPAPAEVPVSPQQAARVQELQQIAATTSTQTSQPQGQDARVQELQALQAHTGSSTSPAAPGANSGQSQAERVQELQSLQQQ